MNIESSIKYGRLLSESIAVVVNEESDVTIPLGRAFNAPIIVQAHTMEGSARLTHNGITETVKVDVDYSGTHPLASFKSRDGEVKLDLTRVKTVLRVSTPNDFIVKRVEKLATFNYIPTIPDYESLDNLTDIDLLIELQNRLTDLLAIKAETEGQLKLINKNTQKPDHTHRIRLITTIDTLLVDYRAMIDIERMKMVNNLEYAQKFTDAAMTVLDADTLSKITKEL